MSKLFTNTITVLVKEHALLEFDQPQRSILLVNRGPSVVCMGEYEHLNRFPASVRLVNGTSYQWVPPGDVRTLLLKTIQCGCAAVFVETRSTVPSSLIKPKRAVLSSDMSAEPYFDEDPLSAILRRPERDPVSMRPVPPAPADAPEGTLNAWFSATGAASVSLQYAVHAESREIVTATELNKSRVPKSRWEDLEYLGLVLDDTR